METQSHVCVIEGIFQIGHLNSLSDERSQPEKSVQTLDTLVCDVEEASEYTACSALITGVSSVPLRNRVKCTQVGSQVIVSKIFAHFGIFGEKRMQAKVDRLISLATNTN